MTRKEAIAAAVKAWNAGKRKPKAAAPKPGDATSIHLDYPSTAIH